MQLVIAMNRSLTTHDPRVPSALAALVLVVSVSACGGPTSTHPVSAVASSPAAQRQGVTDRMPDDSLDARVERGRARTIVTAPDRPGSDRRLDDERRPAELLTFLELRPGARVAVLVAGAGYTADLLARAVGPEGTVYAQNPQFVLASADREWSSRLSSPAMKSVVRVDRELSDPLPPEARELDLALINLVYHDTVWLGVDRDRLNRAVFDALRPGGRYVIIDHSARVGAGVADARTLHRIEQAVVEREVEAAGFRFAKEGDFLRNPADPRDWSDSPDATRERGDTSDRFVVMFEKP